VNSDNSLVVTITVTRYIRASSSGDHFHLHVAPSSGRHTIYLSVSIGVHRLVFGFFGAGIQLDPDSAILNKNRIRPGFGFWGFLMKNGLWDWAVPVIANYVQPAMVTTVLQVFQSVPRIDRKVHYTDAMHKWVTHRLRSWLCDTAWQFNDRSIYAVFELLLRIPCILEWLLFYICDFPTKVCTPHVYIGYTNPVFKLLKDGKLSEKPYAGGKSDIWQDFILATHSPDTNDDCTSIICHCIGICYIL